MAAAAWCNAGLVGVEVASLVVVAFADASALAVAEPFGVVADDDAAEEVAVVDCFDWIVGPAEPEVSSRHLPHQAVSIDLSSSGWGCTSCLDFVVAAVAAVAEAYMRTRDASDRGIVVVIVTDRSPSLAVGADQDTSQTSIATRYSRSTAAFGVEAWAVAAAADRSSDSTWTGNRQLISCRLDPCSCSHPDLAPFAVVAVEKGRTG